MELLQRHPVSGGDVFDLQIVATMQANGIERIYTFNRGDFEGRRTQPPLKTFAGSNCIYRSSA